MWVIDPDRTTWREARPLLRSGAIGPRHGYLEIKRDGRFAIEALPDFWGEWPGPIVAHRSGSGKWWIDDDALSGDSYVFLSFDEVDGEGARHKESHAVYFTQEGSEYFLHVIIWDPDTGDELVLLRASGDRQEKGTSLITGNNE